MNIKIKQKLGKDALATLQAQIKGKGVKVIVFNKDGFVTTDDVLGKVTNVFDLGKKLDAFTDLDKKDHKAEGYTFTKIQNDYYLMQPQTH